MWSAFRRYVLRPYSFNGYDSAGRAFRFYGWISLIIAICSSIFIVSRGFLPNPSNRGHVYLEALRSLIFFCGLSTIQFLTGRAMLDRKKWARTVAAILSLLMVFSFPIGTIFAAYALVCIWKPHNPPWRTIR